MHPVDTSIAHRAPKPTTTASESVLPLTLAALQAWLHTAAPSEMLEYHRGYLAFDRGTGSRLGEQAGGTLDQIATALMAMAEAGRVHLVQRRHGPCDYEYIAVMARLHGHRAPVCRAREIVS